MTLNPMISLDAAGLSPPWQHELVHFGWWTLLMPFGIVYKVCLQWKLIKDWRVFCVYVYQTLHNIPCYWLCCNVLPLWQPRCLWPVEEFAAYDVIWSPLTNICTMGVISTMPWCQLRMSFVYLHPKWGPLLLIMWTVGNQCESLPLMSQASVTRVEGTQLLISSHIPWEMRKVLFLIYN